MDDEDQYMDDLFGENDPVSAINVPIHSAAPVHGLAQRIDSSSTKCCHKIAWSRFGCIAAVGSDGKCVHLRVLVRNPKTGEWHLTKPDPLYPPITLGRQIVHVVWSHMGNDLAVVDSVGRVLIYSTGYLIGQMVLMRNGLTDKEDEMSSLAGLHWLPVYPHTLKSGIFWSATRNNDEWTSRVMQHMVPGPYNPLEGKSALLYLNRSGMLRLLYQQRDSKWMQVTYELDDATSAIEYSYTHASFAPDQDGSLLLVAHQLRGALRAYQIHINWNQSVKEEGQQGPPNVSPTLDVTTLLEENAIAPQHLPSTGHDEASNGLADSSFTYQLSDLSLLPVAPELGARESSQSTVLATYTVLPPPSAITMDASHHYQQSGSIICRWELQKNLDDKVSSCFDTLSVRRRTTTGLEPRHRARLRRHDDISVMPGIISLVPIRQNTMFVLTLSDGTVQFRHRNTLDVVMPDDSPDEVSTLPQSGFVVPPLTSFLHTAFSPSACIVAALEPDGNVKLEKMQYMNGSLTDLKEDDAKHNAIAAVIALQYASGSMQYKITDDIISLLPTNVSPTLTYALVALMSKFMGINFDFDKANEKQIPLLFRNHILCKSLSLQNALGSMEAGQRRLAARLSWITLNLRHVSWNISMNLRSNENLKAEMAISFVGLVKWSMDLCVYLLQELFSIYYAIKHETRKGNPDRASDHTWLHAHIEKFQSPALVLLLCSIPRILLRMLFRPLRHGFIHSSNGLKTSLTIEHKTAFGKLLHVYQSTPIVLPPMEEFFTSLDNSIRKAYAAANTTDVSRAEHERSMFLSARIPSILLPAVTELLTTHLEPLMAKLDPGKIHMHDVSWLCLTDDQRTRRFMDAHTVDVVRKMPLATSARLRICPRCASVMEDIGQGPGMSAQQPWVWQSHKLCVCYSSWTSPEGIRESSSTFPALVPLASASSNVLSGHGGGAGAGAGGGMIVNGPGKTENGVNSG